MCTHTYTHLFFYFQNQKLFFASVKYEANPFQNAFSVGNHPLTSLSIVFQLKIYSCDNGLSSFIRNETANTLRDREPNTLHPDGLGTYQKNRTYIKSAEIRYCEQLKNINDSVLSLVDVAC